MNTLLRDVLSFLYVHTVGQCGPKTGPFLFDSWVLMGHTCTVNVQTWTSRIRPLLSCLSISAPLLPGEMERKEDIGPAVGSTSWLSVISRSLSRASDALFAHLLFWGLYDSTRRAAFSSVAPCLEPLLWPEVAEACPAAPVAVFIYCIQVLRLKGSLKTQVSSPALELV